MSKKKEIFFNYIAQTSPFPLALEIVKGEGSKLWDKRGKEYLDFISGISVSSLGHRHPSIIKAIRQQLDHHLFTMVYGEFIDSAQTSLTEKLVDLLPQTLDNVFYTSTGTEAIEGALKLAKRYSGKHKILSFKGAYHGSTHGSLSVSGNEKKKYAFRPLLPEIEFLEFNNIEDLKRIDEECACVIMETIQADAGVRIPDRKFMKALRKRCSEKNVLLILDEIQVGLGRTGKLFAFQHYDIIPDVLVLGKSFGAGLPLAAFISSRKIMQSLTSDPMLGHITTFGGNPLSCAASFAFLKELDEKTINGVEEKAEILRSYLNHDRITEVRFKGLFFAVEFENRDIVNAIVEDCIKNGVICYWFLSCPEAFRIAPPLNINENDLRKGAETISKAIETYFRDN